MTHLRQTETSSHDRFGDAPIFIFCDHASNAIPDALNCLGLPADLLNTHIAYDIGAAETAEALARALSGELLTCRFSRLVVDPNRSSQASDAIPAFSDRIPIPGNQDLSPRDREKRVEAFHTPYHRELASAISAFANRHEEPLFISVHSFTNRLMGASEERPWPMGLLWREDEASAHFMIDWLRTHTGEPIGDNEPYDARIFNYSVDQHIGPSGARHLTIEIRQDLVSEAQGVLYYSELLAKGIDALRTRQK